MLYLSIAIRNIAKSINISQKQATMLRVKEDKHWRRSNQPKMCNHLSKRNKKPTALLISSSDALRGMNYLQGPQSWICQLLPQPVQPDSSWPKNLRTSSNQLEVIESAEYNFATCIKFVGGAAVFTWPQPKYNYNIKGSFTNHVYQPKKQVNEHLG